MPARRIPDSERAVLASRSPAGPGAQHSLEPLGKRAPTHLDIPQKAAWGELRRAGQLHLAQADAIAVELAAVLLARIRAGSATAAEASSLAGLLTKLGLEPQARRHVRQLTSSSKQPWDDEAIAKKFGLDS
ncbi:MAG TPA: hypothetical protein VNM48_01490 [Chloroflexota bacterium]|nr:hypothetical protein [Chloroflexota bacterium]